MNYEEMQHEKEAKLIKYAEHENLRKLVKKTSTLGAIVFLVFWLPFVFAGSAAAPWVGLIIGAPLMVFILVVRLAMSNQTEVINSEIKNLDLDISKELWETM